MDRQWNHFSPATQAVACYQQAEPKGSACPIQRQLNPVKVRKINKKQNREHHSAAVQFLHSPLPSPLYPTWTGRWTQRKETGMIKDVKWLSHEESLSSLGLFCLDLVGVWQRSIKSSLARSGWIVNYSSLPFPAQEPEPPDKVKWSWVCHPEKCFFTQQLESL